ncbi:CCA tRNA nucleotidyltransferase, partial [Methylopila musalis]
LHRIGPEAFRDRALLAWGDSGAGPDDPHWAALETLPDRWSPPQRPFAAKDFLARGEIGGARLGRLMRAAEAAWVADGFPIDAGHVVALIERVRTETV